MNIRKNIDYSTMYTQIDEAMQKELSAMARYFAIGQAVAERTEKGAAVAAAEYIQKNWPDAKGYSPRNLRRMRELYRVYGDCPKAITLAEQIGWTQNVVILEAELDLQERLWYMREVRQFGWSKLELIEKIENAAHMEIVLDNGLEVCDNETNETNRYKNGRTSPKLAVKHIPTKLLRLIQQRCRGKPKIGVAKWPITLCPIFMEKRTAFMRCLRRYNYLPTIPCTYWDVIDRGPDGIPLLREIMATPNMVMLLGNHEYMMLDYLKPEPDSIAIRRWNKNGNRPTLDAYLKLKAREQQEILDYLRSLPTHLEVEINGNRFYLVHGFPGANVHDEV